MGPLDMRLLRAVLGGAALLLAIAPVRAQSSDDQDVDAASARQQAAEIAKGDPRRWYQEDTSSAARLRTLQKEIGAALREAQHACRRQAAPERAACLKEARRIWRQDLATAREALPPSPSPPR